MKYGFVYIWRDKERNKYYIGSHWGTEDDGYICSSNWMRNAHTRRPEDFKRRILSRIYTNRIDTFLEEERYLNMIYKNELKNRYYNMSNSVKDHWIKDEVKARTIAEKISQTSKGYHNSPATEIKKGQSISPATQFTKGFTPWNKGKTGILTEEDKQRLAKSRVGMKRTRYKTYKGVPR